ncbi:FMN-dependent oxidoreductase (nitrilotriacetate monooxygenase family) [Marinobacterium sp. MBR-111]|jgi:FMN-dependent oxidoreductase (nitrilotriacetate monooxygenase family)|uniref:LLM class flavin-dependent oxidoreductase n=1 Tax=Marinobacterium sp. MBR-111 TaxID=3156463 RepID=UPI003392F54D
MAVKKQISVNAFNMNCIGHINHGLWTHPRDRSTEFNTLGYWTDLARTLEKGLFDAIFIADITGVYDVYQQGVDLTLKESVQLPVNDPAIIISAMAAVTQHLGFGVTANLTYEPPYLLARRFSTLDHLTGGRVGWNIVTGYLESAAKAIGLDNQVPHDRRYDQAEEYLQLMYKLWEGSWEPGSVIKDRQQRIYADPTKVHKIQHAGEFYRSEGYHLCEPSPQRTPLLFQAGTSDKGIAFAGRHAECSFISGGTPDKTREQVNRLRQAAVDAGRRPDDIRLYVGVNVVVAATEAEAKSKHQEYLRYASPEAGLAHYSSTTGIDLARYELDEPIGYAETQAIDSVTRRFKDSRITRRQLLEQHALGGRYPTLVGDPVQIADALESLVDETGIDGFNLARIVTPESYEDFATYVVPELQNRGRYKTHYAEGTIREKLFAAEPWLPGRHPGAQLRNVR